MKAFKIPLLLSLLLILSSTSNAQKLYGGLALSMGVGASYDFDNSEGIYTYAVLPFLNYEHSLSLKNKLVFGLNFYTFEDEWSLLIPGFPTYYDFSKSQNFPSCSSCKVPRIRSSYLEIPIYYRWEPKPWSSWDLGLVYMIPIKSEISYQEAIANTSGETTTYTPGDMITFDSMDPLSSLFGISLQKGFKINSFFLSIYSTAGWGSTIEEGSFYYEQSVFSGGFRAAYRLK